MRNDITFVLDETLSDDPIFTVSIVTPLGTLGLMAEIMFENGVVELRGLHIGGDPATEWGWSRLRTIARWATEVLDVDEIIVVGAIRTSGANPGRRPGRYRIRRPPRTAPDPECTP